jgi:hypothetical protein
MIPYIEKLQTTLYWKRPYINTEKNVNIEYFPDNIENIGPSSVAPWFSSHPMSMEQMLRKKGIVFPQ